MFLRGNISADNCARELFKPSKDSASLHVFKEKFFLFWVSRFFVSDTISGICFRPFWSTSSGSRPKPLDGSMSLKFLLETNLKSESFNTLIDLLRFWVQKL